MNGILRFIGKFPKYVYIEVLIISCELYFCIFCFNQVAWVLIGINISWQHHEDSKQAYSYSIVHR